MDDRIAFIFTTLDSAKIGLATASRIMDGVVTRTTLLNWRKGISCPRTAFSEKIVYNYALLIKRAVDKGLLPLRGKMAPKEKLAATRTIIRAMKD